jgi:hypothetical protein
MSKPQRRAGVVEEAMEWTDAWAAIAKEEETRTQAVGEGCGGAK